MDSMSRSIWSISRIERRDLRGQRGVAVQQRLGRQRDHLLAQRAHFDQILVQQRKLLVKTGFSIIQTSP